MFSRVFGKSCGNLQIIRFPMRRLNHLQPYLGLAKIHPATVILQLLRLLFVLFQPLIWPSRQLLQLLLFLFSNGVFLSNFGRRPAIDCGLQSKVNE